MPSFYPVTTDAPIAFSSTDVSGPTWTTSGGFIEILPVQTTARVITSLCATVHTVGGNGLGIAQVAFGGAGSEVVVGEMIFVTRAADLPLPLLVPAGTRVSFRLLVQASGASFAGTMRVVHRAANASRETARMGWTTIRNVNPSAFLEDTLSGNPTSWQTITEASNLSAPLVVIGCSIGNFVNDVIEFGVGSTPTLIEGSQLAGGSTGQRGEHPFILPPSQTISLRGARAGMGQQAVYAIYAVSPPFRWAE